MGPILQLVTNSKIYIIMMKSSKVNGVKYWIRALIKKIFSQLGQVKNYHI